jgi:cytoskeletal protein RodZ
MKKTASVCKDHLPNLTAIRERRGISLKEIEADTKISTRFLRAIENGDFDELPGGIFNVSYIRQYARKIDYAEDDLVAAYEKATGIAKGAFEKSDEKPVSRKKPPAAGRLSALLGL